MLTGVVFRWFVYHWEDCPGQIRIGVELPSGHRLTWLDGEPTLYSPETWKGHAIQMVIVGWLDAAQPKES